MKVSKAVIPAAGFGTRFLPFTKAVPKELVPVVDKPTLQYVVEEAAAAGIDQILMVVSTGKTSIQDHFNGNAELEARLAATGRTAELEELRRINTMAEIHYVYQRELNGLGDAVRYGRIFAGNDPFAVLLGDTVTSAEPGCPSVTAQLLDAFARTGGSPVVALEEVPRDKVGRYGVIDGADCGEGLFRLRHLVEKPRPEEAPSNLVIASRYVFTPEIFACLDRTPRGKGNEIQLTDAMRLLLEEREMYGLRFRGRRHDIGNKLDFVKTTIEFALRRDDLRGPLTDFLRRLQLDLPSS